MRPVPFRLRLFPITMKTNLLISALVVALSTAAFAAPLTQTTAVHTKPDTTSPAITYLKAGTEPAEAPSVAAPAGWMAVELPGPFEGYVNKSEMTKGLEVKPGTPIRLAPEPTGAVLTIAQRGDKTEISGLRGRWAQISLKKSLIGYINVGAAPAILPPVATAPAVSNAVIPATPVGNTALPVAAPAPSTAAGQPAVASTAEDSASLPRQLTGKFVSTRSVLRPRRPYDWALEDNSGRRFAYVDISRLLLTEQIDKYIDHYVVVFGAAKPTPDGKDIVIQVESLQLLMR